MNRFPIWLLTLLPSLCVACGPVAMPPSELPAEVTPEQALAFIHANVVPMDSERVLPDHTVVVREGRIEAVGPAAEVSVPADALAVDATGK